MKLTDIAKAFGVPEPKIPKGTSPAKMLDLVEEHLGLTGTEGKHPIAGYTSKKALKFAFSNADGVDVAFGKVRDYLEDNGDAMIGSTTRSSTPPGNPRFAQKVYHMGDNLHVAIAYTGYDENKEHCLYVTAYKA
jgi:hypothetical protein